jgi:hypothetical protein
LSNSSSRRPIPLVRSGILVTFRTAGNFRTLASLGKTGKSGIHPSVSLL